MIVLLTFCFFSRADTLFDDSLFYSLGSFSFEDEMKSANDGVFLFFLYFDTAVAILTCPESI
jgi:hypothetical protein